MKEKKEKKEVNKFNLDKFKVAKLKNLHAIKGGNNALDDPIDGSGNKVGGSSRQC